MPGPHQRNDGRRNFPAVESLEQLKQHRANNIQKEIRVDIAGQSLVMQMTLSLLRDEQQNDLGIVLVFDDLTMLVNAQRASAWREVARRIATHARPRGRGP